MIEFAIIDGDEEPNPAGIEQEMSVHPKLL
jgi:hypothetical protein